MGTVEYLGGLRTEAKHLKSGNLIVTDAPPDNNGRGEAFSPTDLVSAALCSCMMTIMGMVAEIAEVQITFSHPGLVATEVQKQKLKNAAHTCPVALSLADSVKQTVVFNF
ncbi:MAG: OsmC family peroxiredoxin [Bacteroidetes bacterium CHB5]|nr:OsmC family peroxiredoxin [Bacteroidetes bacterium CHB5]